MIKKTYGISQKSVFNSIIIFLLAMSFSQSGYGATIYVKQDSSGDGSSWASAFGQLQDALNIAVSGDEIWVTAGTYKPTYDYGLGVGDRGKHFRMINGVAIYGGFDGAETSLDQRNCENNETILSGDIGIQGYKSDNCYHVFFHNNYDNELNRTAILDSVTITGGNANEPFNGNQFGHQFGGGMWNVYGSPTLINCKFNANESMFDGNSIYNDYGSSPKLINCKIIGHFDAITNVHSTPVFENCTFTGNSQGINNWHSSPTINNCKFNGNGGAIYNWYSGSRPIITNCVFNKNTLCGVYNIYSSSPDIVNCTFIGNDAGIINYETCNPTIANCTFFGNAGDSETGAVLNYANSNPTLFNCILWGNSPEIFNDSSTPTVLFSCVEGGYSGAGNISSDPLFIDADGFDNTSGTEDDNLRLQIGSPCIDTGDNTFLPADTTDLDGDGDTTEAIPFDLDEGPRVLDGDNNASAIVDMGAYELKYIEQTVAPSQATTLIPNGGSGTATEDAQVTFENLSGTSTTVSAAQFDNDLHDSENSYCFMGTTLVVNTQLADGQFFATIKVPFTANDLNGLNWRLLNLQYWNGSSWELAVSGNTQNSPSHASVEGDRFEVEDTVPPTLSNELGDYGVFWNPAENKGFVWANVDHATDFAAIVLLGDFEPNGDVDLVDFAIIAAAWMSDDTPTANWNPICDLDGSGDIGIGDLVKFSENWLAGK